MTLSAPPYSGPTETIPAAPPNPCGVDQYDVTVVERDGFKFVQVRLLLDDGRATAPFEFVPAFAHALSDELCKASAHAAAK
jgi:hypothetical protein